MKRVLTGLLAAAVAGALFVAAPLGAAPKNTNHNKSADNAASCDNDNELVVFHPEKLWPPNHKYFDELHVRAVDGQDGQVTLTTIGYHDQWDGDTGAEMNGSGNTIDDIRVNPADEGASWQQSEDGQQVLATESADGNVQTDWQARAERSGRLKEGRTYTLEATALFSDMTECSHEVTFSVPHDMRPSNR